MFYLHYLNCEYQNNTDALHSWKTEMNARHKNYDAAYQYFQPFWHRWNKTQLVNQQLWKFTYIQNKYWSASESITHFLQYLTICPLMVLMFILLRVYTCITIWYKIRTALQTFRLVDSPVQNGHRTKYVYSKTLPTEKGPLFGHIQRWSLWQVLLYMNKI